MVLRIDFQQVVAGTLVALMFCLANSAVSLAGEWPEESNSANNHPVNKILQERRSVFKELVKVHFEANQTNQGNIEPVIRACRQLLSAELEMESRREERTRLIMDFIETMSDCEMLAKQMYKANKTTVADVLEATACRLDGQAQLLREQEKQKP